MFCFLCKSPHLQTCYVLVFLCKSSHLPTSYVLFLCVSPHISRLVMFCFLCKSSHLQTSYVFLGFIIYMCIVLCGFLIISVGFLHLIRDTHAFHL